MIRYEKDDSQIVTLTIDMPGRAVNVINEGLAAAFGEAIDRLAADAAVAGVILTSAKSSFIVGADIEMLQKMSDPAATFAQVEAQKALFRRLERLGKPVVAALNGTALGGGLEVALACHYRVALDRPDSRFGFPEVTLGLLPGGGGIVRLTRLLGLQAAFPYLMEGTQLTPKEAAAAGLIQALAADPAEMMQQARAWIQANPQAAQPWDRPGYRLPGGDPQRPQVAQMISVAPAALRQKTFGNYPAPEAILSVMVDGALVDFETASRIESRAFTQLATGPTAKNMINAFWFQLNEIKKGRSRPHEIAPTETKKVGVLGAGMMGHGIAYVSALAGLEVVLKDATAEKAAAGKARIEGLLDGRLRQNRITAQQKAAILDRIQVSGAAADLAGCDLVIEAVFENRELKAAVTRETEAHLADDAVFASNTSTLPITGLATAAARPQSFVGLHFFSPVPQMKLVEIIRGQQTSDRALATAFDFVLKIQKTPIVVNDSRGFYTSRVFTLYVYEGMAMLAEGQPARTIEMAGLQAGMPIGPLAVSDEVNLGLALEVRELARRELAAEGRTLPGHPADEVLQKMVRAAQRAGKAQGAGFYEYPTGGKKYLWPGLRDLFPASGEKLSQQEMIERLMFVQALETARCYAEGVVTSAADANLGSILGWGFAPFKGGTLQYINDYGLPAFVQRSQQLAAKYGNRFSPPVLLVEMAARGATF